MGEVVQDAAAAITAAGQQVAFAVEQAVHGQKIPNGSAVQTPYGVGVLDTLRADGIAVVTLDFFAKAYLQPSQITALKTLPATGSRITTMYGDGVLQEVRKEDGCVVVKFDFGGTGYLRPDQIRPVRAKPFVPASYWSSGIFADKVVPAAHSLKRAQEALVEKVVAAVSADPAEEKVDAPVVAEAAPEAAPAASETPAAASTTSSKKKKKSGRRVGGGGRRGSGGEGLDTAPPLPAWFALLLPSAYLPGLQCLLFLPFEGFFPGKDLLHLGVRAPGTAWGRARVATSTLGRAREGWPAVAGDLFWIVRRSLDFFVKGKRGVGCGQVSRDRGAAAFLLARWLADVCTELRSRLQALTELKDSLKAASSSSKADLLGLLEAIEKSTLEISRVDFVASKVGGIVKKTSETSEHKETKAKARMLMQTWKTQFASSTESPAIKKPRIAEEEEEAHSQASVESSSAVVLPEAPKPKKPSGVNLAPPQDAKRKKICKLLGDIFVKDGNEFPADTITNCCIELERELHEVSKADFAAKYQVLKTKLPKNDELRRFLLSGEMESSELIKMTEEEMTPALERAASAKLLHDFEEAKRSDWHDVNRAAILAQAGVKDQTGFFKCGRCQSTKTAFYQKQTRGADEPMTVFVQCLDCKNRWKTEG
ncbi:transcription elongation factor S-II [Batrachochytrium salamandrivorans]|nr:transcription elongation factor S-II [Batrachochytrium salamandrivorans]